MKTAMQYATAELLDEFKDYPIEDITKIVAIMHRNLETEKQQIIEAGNSCALKQYILNSRIEKMTDTEIKYLADLKENTFGEEYYNENYEQ